MSQVVFTVLVVGWSSVALAKAIAMCATVPALIVRGRHTVKALRDEGRLETANFSAEFNRIDRLLENWAERQGGRRARFVQVVFTMPSVVTVGTVLVLLPGSKELPVTHLDWAQLVLALLTVTCVLALVLVAIFRRMVLGNEEWRTSDLNPQRFGVPQDWALTESAAGVRSVYLLTLIYFLVMGFAALYAAICGVQESAFVFGGNGQSGVTWIYFSVTTMATIGFGDVHATSAAAKWAVISQIASGPLVVTWLLASLSDQGAPPPKQGAEGADRHDA